MGLMKTPQVIAAEAAETIRKLGWYAGPRKSPHTKSSMVDQYGMPTMTCIFLALLPGADRTDEESAAAMAMVCGRLGIENRCSDVGSVNQYSHPLIKWNDSAERREEDVLGVLDAVAAS